MKPILLVAYLLMAIWLIIAAGRRIALTLNDGQDVDIITFISGGIGILALLLLLLAIGERQRP